MTTPRTIKASEVVKGMRVEADLVSGDFTKTVRGIVEKATLTLDHSAVQFDFVGTAEEFMLRAGHPVTVLAEPEPEWVEGAWYRCRMRHGDVRHLRRVSDGWSTVVDGYTAWMDKDDAVTVLGRVLIVDWPGDDVARAIERTYTPGGNWIAAENTADTYSDTYRRNASTTTAVTVVPSRFAFATASRHSSGGMRSERGIVAMSRLPSVKALRRDHRAEAICELDATRPRHLVIVEHPDARSAAVEVVIGGVRVEEHADRGSRHGRKAYRCLMVAGPPQLAPGETESLVCRDDSGDAKPTKFGVPLGCSGLLVAHLLLLCLGLYLQTTPDVSTRQHLSDTSFQEAAA